MKNLHFSPIALLIAFLVIFSCSVAARPYNEGGAVGEQESLPDVLQSIVESSEGNVELEIPEEIANGIVSAPKSTVRKQEPVHRQNTGPAIQKQEGYRVQIFADGRNQSTLLSRAKARGNAVAVRFPKYRGQIYTFSSSPNVYCRVGNFTSQAQASAALSELKRAFPQFAGEMRVVRSKIVIIK